MNDTNNGGVITNREQRREKERGEIGEIKKGYIKQKKNECQFNEKKDQIHLMI